jgi:broad specificity phosphatase PhoE
MSADLPKLYLARHGDTAWTDSHQHTGRTDLPLNERGEEHARQLGERLRQQKAGGPRVSDTAGDNV